MKPMVFLHGWAQSRQIWYQQQAQFPDAMYLNLPGHGGDGDQPAEKWLETLVTQLPEQPCLLVGWSLGGILAMAIAKAFPERVDSLVLVAATPCFCQQPGWLHGCDDKAFAGFHAAVASASPRALNRFFALMLHGDDLLRSAYNELARSAVDRTQTVGSDALAAGLSLLAEVDLRSRLPDVPALIIHGSEDAIVPVQAGRWLVERLHGAQMHELEGCGHAPFLTQPDQFNSILRAWSQS